MTSPGPQSSALEYGPQDYYPSAKLRLILRFDEFAQTSRLGKVPKKPSIVLKGVNDPRDPLEVVGNPLGPGFIIAPKGSSGKSQSGTAQTATGSTDGLTFEIAGIIPQVAEWSQNGIRLADTLTATIRYVDCPVDPRLVRAAAVEFYLGTVKAADFAAGIRGATRAAATPPSGAAPARAGGDAAEPLNLVPDTFVDSRNHARSNLRFQGWVDKWVVSATDVHEPTIQIECRDNTQVLLDTPAPKGRPVSETLPLDKAIATYLTFAPAFGGLTVMYLPTTETPPMLKDAIRKLPASLGPIPSKGGGATSATAKTSVWDFLTDVCRSIGHSIRVQGTNIIIQRTRSLVAAQAPTRADDPFAGGRQVGDETLQVRRMIYGRNIKEMRVTRNFTKNAPANISVRSYSTRDKSVTVGRFPETPDRAKYAIPGDSQPDQKWLELNISQDVHDPKKLQIIAQEIYENLGRQEMQVELKTVNLASFGGDNLDPDILDMKAGDTFELFVGRERETEVSTIGKVEQLLLSAGFATALLTTQGYSTDFANAYYQAYSDAGFLTQFRLQHLKTLWSADTGVSLNIMGVNYIEVRSDVQLDGESGTTKRGGPGA